MQNSTFQSGGRCEQEQVVITLICCHLTTTDSVAVTTRANDLQIPEMPVGLLLLLLLLLLHVVLLRSNMFVMQR